MKTRNFFRKMMLSTMLAAPVAVMLTMSSCSGGDDGNPVTPDIDKIKTAKFTIQVSGLEANDFANFIFSTGNAGTGSTFWKVNGTERPNETVVSVDEDGLISGTTYIIETTRPVTAISAGYQFTNGDNTLHSPITFSYKAEINGKIVKDIKNQAIPATEQINQNYSYTE